MTSDEADEPLMTRFVLGEVTPDERDRVERRFMADPTFFEALCALEDELLLLHAQGRLPAPQERLLMARLNASPVLRRQAVEVDAVAEVVGAHASPAARRRRMQIVTWVAAAAVIPVAFAGIWQIVGRQEPPATAAASRTAPQAPPSFLLAPGNVRTTTEPQANVLRVPADAEVVSLEAIVPNQPLRNARAALEIVGGSAIDGRFDFRVRPRDGGLEVAVQIPAQLLTPGDYLLTITADTDDGSQTVVTTRFFSVAP